MRLRWGFVIVSTGFLWFEGLTRAQQAGTRIIPGLPVFLWVAGLTRAQQAGTRIIPGLRMQEFVGSRENRQH